MWLRLLDTVGEIENVYAQADIQTMDNLMPFGLSVSLLRGLKMNDRAKYILQEFVITVISAIVFCCGMIIIGYIFT
jgi:hypothetical protein